MPLGICVSQAEMDLISAIWPDPAPGMPINKRGVIEFSPSMSRQIVDDIQTEYGIDDPIAVKLLNRFVDIAGASFLDGATNPVAIEPESDDIEQEDSDQIELDFDADEDIE